MQRYENYKPSGVKWLGDVPAHWETFPFKGLFRMSTEKNGKAVVGEMLSVSGYRGIEVKPYEFEEQKRTEAELRDYRVVRPGQLVVNTMWLNHTGLGVSEYEGHVSPAYRSYWFAPQLRARYVHYLMRSHSYVQGYTGQMQGIRPNSLQIKNSDFTKIPILVPPQEEQDQIVAFLDQKTAEIDAAIAKKERLIELLEEQAAILISNAVTKGLNADAPRSDSGVAWIGHIPSHWYVKRAKFLFREIDERSANGEEELLSVSHMTGVTPRSEKTNVYMFMAEDYSGSKLCRPNDLVFNIMWAWMGALGVSDRVGIVSPSYGVYRQLKEGTFNNWYLEHLLRSTLYVAEYNKRSTGLHSSRLRLYSHMLFDMELGFPPREEQDEIERETKKQVSQANAVITSVRSEIEKLAELRSSLVASVVTGKMRV